MSYRYLTSRVRGPAAVVALLAAVLILAACSGEPGVAQLDITGALDLPPSVPLGEPLRLAWTWTPGPDFVAPAEDYKIFVHLVDPQGTILLQDDHYPTEPTSQWKAGVPVSYERWMYVPELRVDYIDIVAGLYAVNSAGDVLGRAEIRGEDGWQDAPVIHKLGIRQDDVSGIPVYMTGWHTEEITPGGKHEKWRWTEDTARAVFTNPQHDAVLHLIAHSPFDELGGPQTIVLLAGDKEITRLVIENSEDFLRRIDVPASLMDEAEWLELNFQVSPYVVPKTLDPASADERKLGLQVFFLYLSAS